MDVSRAILMVLVMSLASLSGCFGEDVESGSLGGDSLNVYPSIIPAGEWVVVTLKADVDMSVFVPYFIQDPGSLRAQNGTVFDLKKGESISMNALFPPRNSDVVLLIGDYGRVDWPIRGPGVSWYSWTKGATDGSSSISAVENQDAGGATSQSVKYWSKRIKHLDAGVASLNGCNSFMLFSSEAYKLSTIFEPK